MDGQLDGQFLCNISPCLKTCSLHGGGWVLGRKFLDREIAVQICGDILQESARSGAVVGALVPHTPVTYAITLSHKMSVQFRSCTLLHCFGHDYGLPHDPRLLGAS